jgi:RHS repeat-associated protein
MATAARSILLLLAACCSLWSHIPRTALLAQNSPPGLEPFAPPLHPAQPAANSLTATGFCECLYDSGRRFHFTGKERDGETGLDYFGARYMSSAQGRFTSPDPKLYPDAVLDSQSWNKYGYVRNNPLRLVDPNGEDWKDVASGFMNAFNTNQVLGIGRTQDGNSDFKTGQAFGDAVSTLQGVAEMIVGGGGEVGGLALDATGVGAVAGVPLNIASAGVIVHGTAVAGTGLKNLTNAAFQSSVDPGTPTNTMGGGQLGEANGPKPGSSGGPGAGRKATPQERAKALSENNGNCVFCGKPATEADHAIPRARGGNNTTGPNGNLQPTCTNCNRGPGGKHTNTSEEFLRKKQPE